MGNSQAWGVVPTLTGKMWSRASNRRPKRSRIHQFTPPPKKKRALAVPENTGRRGLYKTVLC